MCLSLTAVTAPNLPKYSRTRYHHEAINLLPLPYQTSKATEGLRYIYRPQVSKREERIQQQDGFIYLQTQKIFQGLEKVPLLGIPWCRGVKVLQFVNNPAYDLFVP